MKDIVHREVHCVLSSPLRVPDMCVSLLIVQIECLSASPGLDDDTLEAIEASFQQFNVFLDLLRSKG